jgi:hypothetical protein
MKSLIIALLLMPALPATYVLAASSSIHQTGVANVYGLVEVGQSQPVSVTQSGRYNIVGVVQAGKTNTIGISQTGIRNSAYVDQLAAPSATRFRGEMP